jgi:hypothetical protein
MTVTEYDEKIANLKIIRDEATGMEKADLTAIISDLNTARLAHLLEDLTDLVAPFSADDVAELTEIANVFENATEEIENANELIDNAISLGGKIVELVT